nr:flagellin [Butyrivibrio sp.]
MIISHNLSAMNAQRMYNINSGQKAKTAEKLSSGYRINRAADDAAGLAISEKMRRQVRGLSQAVLNSQDGISMVQTAEGALDEIHQILQRMNELSVKAANDTYTSEDRRYIQSELDALLDEVDRTGA